MDHYLYKQTRDTGEYYYGIHSTKNMEDGYAGSGIKFQRKYKSDPSRFIKEIVGFYNSREELEEAEESLVGLEMLEDTLCLNLKTGGANGLPSEETKGKISSALTGLPASEEAKSNMSIAKSRENHPFWGISHSSDHNMNISLALTGLPASEEAKLNMSIAQSGENHNGWGKRCTKETRAKMSAAQLGEKNHRFGKTLSDEAKARLSEVNSGENNASYDHSTYTFIHDVYGEFTGGRWEFIEEFNDHKVNSEGVGAIIRKIQKSHRGWKLKN